MQTQESAAAETRIHTLGKLASDLYLIWNRGPTRERIHVDCTYTGRFMPLVVAVMPS
jgi:hypothetical protein